ncbi:hypothetical protein B9Z55_025493 [Caenorhabditis nigoni]|uniref:Uncharacterized protein n=2 Tax=Caenorhabditis nigoni TaxID=1611254 RepID=A0A2G5SZ28_9PELO|nr:hypothetical protein B9Z55_025493 [Caenorhabditis nigoni]
MALAALPMFHYISRFYIFNGYDTSGHSCYAAWLHSWIISKFSELPSNVDALIDMHDHFSVDYGRNFLLAMAEYYSTQLQSLHAINQMASNRSVHARNVHKKLIYLLCAQMMFPMGAYAIGGSTIVISLSMQLVWMQQAFNFAILIFSNYGFAASMCLIVCNEPYLRHTKKLFSCDVRSRKKNSAIVRVIDRSVVLT